MLKENKYNEITQMQKLGNKQGNKNTQQLFKPKKTMVAYYMLQHKQINEVSTI